MLLTLERHFRTADRNVRAPVPIGTVAVLLCAASPHLVEASASYVMMEQGQETGVVA
jgi:hypothetical protein